MEDQNSTLLLVSKHMDIPMVVLSSEGTILESNQAAHQLLLTPGEALDQLLSMESRFRLQLLLGHLNKETNEEHTIHLLETELQAPDSSDSRPVTLHLQRLPTSPPTFGMWVEDRSQIAKQEEELRNLLHIASHDLRAPLDTISSLLDLCRQLYSEQLGDEGSEMLSMCGERSQELARIFEGLVLTYRIGLVPAPEEPVPLNEVITEIASELDATRRCDTFSVDDLPQIKGVREWLRLALRALIENALVYVAPGAQPSISIRYSLKEQEHHITVQDQGIGIHPRYYERIFELFQRLHNAEDYPGIGLGLTLARRVAQAYKGRIELSSSEGKGSSFTFILPLRSTA